jgi:hypothetical protein
MGKLEDRKPPGRLRRRWEDYIEVDLLEVGWRLGLDRSGSGQLQVVGSCECGNEPSTSIKCGDILTS